jgi:hypothetical protein
MKMACRLARHRHQRSISWHENGLHNVNNENVSFNWRHRRNMCINQKKSMAGGAGEKIGGKKLNVTGVATMKRGEKR